MNQMNPNDEIISRDLALIEPMPETDERHTTHPLRRLHALLRGRYPFAIVLAILLAVGGAFLGWRSVELKYRSQAHIQVRFNIEKVMYDTEDTGYMAGVNDFIGQQIDQIRSRRVIRLAMEDSKWVAFNRGNSPEAEAKFIKSMAIFKGGAKSFYISYSDTDPQAAFVATQALLGAYLRLYGEQDVKDDARKLQVLEERRATLTNQLNQLNDQILEIGKEVGSTDLTSMHADSLARLQDIKARLYEHELALAEADDILAASAENEEGEITPKTIAMSDRRMQSLIDRRTSIEQAIAVLELKFGPGHHEVIEANAHLELVNSQIQEYFDRYMAAQEQDDENDPRVVIENRGIAALRTRIESLRQLRDKYDADTVALGNKNTEIQRLKSEADTVSKLLDDTVTRIDQLNIESGSGRIHVNDRGQLRHKPFNADDRKKKTVIGAFLGFCMGFGVFIVIGFFDKRLRHSDDAQLYMKGLRLLGILPYLPEDFDDPERATITGYCVHHIRAMLQLGVRENRSEIFAVTSPASGTGKTSLTLAIGLSFAAAGSRTLLIDSDLAGGGLSRRLEVIIRRQIGQVLVRAGLINDEQLDEALRISQVTGKLIGETVVSLGFVTEQQLAESLSLQDQAKVGFLDALDGEPLDECVSRTEVDNLFILPVGGAKADDMSRVAPESMQRVFAAARDQFDIILVDTGPVPGSVESSMVCAGADKVVTVVSRGEHRPDADNAIGFLNSIGANVLGIVFNRADEPDFNRSSYSASMMSRRSIPREGHTDPADTITSSRFGPLAREVAGSSVHTNEPDIHEG